MPDEPPSEVSAHADRISVIINSSSQPADASGAFDLICKKYSLRDTSTIGFLGCKKPFLCDADIAYETQNYLTPDGKKVALFCSVGSGCSPNPVGCDGGYRVYKDLVVNFRFSTTELRVEEFIAADQELRRRITNAEVTGFRWSDQTGTKSGNSQ
jgi:hypothetical protein